MAEIRASGRFRISGRDGSRKLPVWAVGSIQAANAPLPSNRAHTYYEDPVRAYGALATRYVELRRSRAAYLDAIETIISQRIPAQSHSLLDVGAGDGARSFRLVRESAIERIVLVEPSSSMILPARKRAVVWPVRAEDLSAERTQERFDVIVCLWNVLGHLPTAEKRSRALHAIGLLLSPRGTFFLDVTHRYNLRSYGLVPTCARWMRDFLMPDETNGDVRASWSFVDASISTYGHVFTHKEIIRLTHGINRS